MKNLSLRWRKLLLICFIPLHAVYADTIIDLAKQPIICGKYTISPQSIPSALTKNCQIVEIKQKREWIFYKYLKISLYPDNLKNQKVNCNFTNNILKECKFD